MRSVPVPVVAGAGWARRVVLLATGGERAADVPRLAAGQLAQHADQCAGARLDVTPDGRRPVGRLGGRLVDRLAGEHLAVVLRPAQQVLAAEVDKGDGPAC